MTTYTDLQNKIRIALDDPSTGNRLVASLALEDFADGKDERIERLEAFVHKLCTSPRAPQWVVNEAREAIAMDGDEYIAHLDKAREWPTAENN